MYLYKDLTAPTAVNHCLCAKITSSNRPNLVVAKSTLIQVFSFITHNADISDPSSVNTQSNGTAGLNALSHGSEKDGADGVNPSIYGATDEESFLDMSLQPSLQESQQKLILTTEYKLSGIVSSLGAIKSSTLNGHDCLILATESAKMSVLEWDSDSNTLVTLSLHYYELPSLKSSSGDSSDYSTFLRVDYSTSLACLKFNRDMLAFLPFRRNDQDLLEPDASATGTDGASSVGLPKLFHPSFAVSAFKLDSTIAHIADTAFLYEYREPTLAILSSPRRTCTGLLEVTRDNMSLVVIALDVLQKASTTILSVQDLPYDLHTIVPLPQPVGGLVLLGCNEIIHVDQSGRAMAIAVNKFTEKTSGMDMVDKSSLNLYLEESRALWVNKLSRLLLITKDGRLFWIYFEMEGRTVSQLVIEDLHVRNIERLPSPSCMIDTPEGCFLLGSTTGNSLLIGYPRTSKTLKNSSDIGYEGAANSTVIPSKPTKDEANSPNNKDEDLYGSTGFTDDYDELYGESTSRDVAKSGFNAAIKSPKDIAFSIWDCCVNHGPIIDMTIGKPSSKGVLGSVEAEIVVSRGTGASSGLSCFRQSLIPDASGRFSIPNSSKLWAISVADKDTTANGTVMSSEAQADASDAEAAAAAAGGGASVTGVSFPIHRYLAVDRAKSNQTLLLDISSSKIKDVKSSFDTKCSTVAMGNLLDSSLIIQCTPNELRVYDSDLEQIQKLPLLAKDKTKGKDDDSTNVVVKSCKFCDPYISLTLSDGSFKLYIASRPSYKLELLHFEEFHGKVVDIYITETRNEHLIRKAQKLSGKRKRKKDGTGTITEDLYPLSMHIALFIDASNRLDVFDIANSKLLFSSGSSIEDLPLIIEQDSEKSFAKSTADSANSNLGENKEDGDSALCEVLQVELGDITNRDEYLILRTASNEICLYKPFLSKQGTELKYQRISSCNLARYKSGSTNDKGNRSPVSMHYLPNVADYGLVFVKGERPFWIIKTRHSMPHFVPHAHKDIVWVSSFNTPNVSDGFIILDKAATVVINSLPTDFSYDGSWPAKMIDLPRIEGGVYGLSYHENQNVYTVTQSQKIPFHAVDEDGDLIEGAQDVGDMGTAQSEKGKLQLISPASWINIDEYEFQDNEIPLVIKTVELQYSERSTATKEYIAIGTGLMRGEDLAMRGSIYLFEVISVVPKPDEPETKNKLKLVVKEDVKGAVSSICAVNGYLMAAQGQKVMVRSLQEDRSILPVAFIDVNAYMTDCKSIQNLLIMSDVFRSLWFVGFSYEPYALTLFGKDSVRINGVCADFLVDKSSAAFLLADDKGHLHILQYDPDDPRSLSGQRLLRKSVFQVGTQVQTMRMIPRAAVAGDTTTHTNGEAAGGPNNNTVDRYMCLGGTGSGNLVLVSPVDESAYRHLHVVGQQLSDHRYLPHVGGLNPRVFRQPTGSQRLIDLMNSTSVGDVRIKRPILDGNIIWRFVQEVDNRSRREIARRVGRNSLTTIWDEILSIAESIDYF